MKEILKIRLSDVVLEGELVTPSYPKALVLFAHGSGSGRFSPRNNFIAQFFNKNGLATFLFDLNTPSEKGTGQLELPLFANRLSQLTQWLQKNSKVGKLPIFYFGGSTGAAVAVAAAFQLKSVISGIISRGGRLDFAVDYIPEVSCPMLWLVGSLDHEVLRLNQACYKHFPEGNELRIIAGARHLFEEPGKLEQVAEESTDWIFKVLQDAKNPGKKKKIPNSSGHV
ncbi:MAG: alpha/beta hydrolase [Algoriphagus sp.]|uniref:dienelactone hydrolase family protein n=1 Tax=Algoriphagus sp. TaxID=1872435 RepID=UPI00184D743B|nr:alpha/beta family hydrolase [Algoriphagus sp.]NVJ84693.1 alpha/beta hydrolase [Algoriphagus sp.]